MIASAIRFLFWVLVFGAAGALPVDADGNTNRATLRVCADPANLPFTDHGGLGFENKIAEMLAGKLQVPVTYAWFPQTLGFIRNTLKAKKCDLILGAVADQEPLQSTDPYYRSAYALIYRADSDLSGVDRLNDPRLKARSIGIVAGTPPATIMAANGLLANSKSFPLAIDRRHNSPAERMVADVAEGRLDAGILWGPIAGYYARRNGGGVTVVPLLREIEGPQMIFPITMGVRHGDAAWKEEVNALIARHKSEIDTILRDFGVPVVECMTAASAQGRAVC
jgi:quinoprotein dehydrogenase-associated probable ABC transporter substrate-binding protein